MYAIDKNEARKADSTGNQIKEIGKYVGKFTQAEDITAKTGTKGVALTFESIEGQKTRLSLYTLKSDGEKIMGFQALMAIMTCLNLDNLDSQPGQVLEWDNDLRKEVTRPGKVFPMLCKKPIGLLLETEDYLSNAGELKQRMVMKGVFQYKTELTASEIIDGKTKPEQLTRMVAGLRHRPLKAGANAPRQENSASAPPYMDDDIPWN